MSHVDDIGAGINAFVRVLLFDIKNQKKIILLQDGMIERYRKRIKELEAAIDAHETPLAID